MSLNIKSPEAHELAAELARLTGESMTKAVTEALRERLERKRRERDREKMVAEAMAIARRVVSYPRKDRRPHGEFLYDEEGRRRARGDPALDRPRDGARHHRRPRPGAPHRRPAHPRERGLGPNTVPDDRDCGVGRAGRMVPLASTKEPARP